MKHEIMNGRKIEVFSMLHLLEMHVCCISSNSVMIGFSPHHVEYFLISQSSAKLYHYFPQTLYTRRGLDCLFEMNVGDWKNYILCKFWRLYISTTIK